MKIRTTFILEDGDALVAVLPTLQALNVDNPLAARARDAVVNRSFTDLEGHVLLAYLNTQYQLNQDEKAVAAANAFSSAIAADFKAVQQKGYTYDHTEA